VGNALFLLIQQPEKQCRTRANSWTIDIALVKIFGLGGTPNLKSVGWTMDL